MRLSVLTKGLIPVGSPCPFKDRCVFAHDGTCKHRGAEHPVPFSCALARGFDLIDSTKGASDAQP